MSQATVGQMTNIADPAVQLEMMRRTVSLLEQEPEPGFVLMSVVAAFIDGLAKGLLGVPARRILPTSSSTSRLSAQSLVRRRSTPIFVPAVSTSSPLGHLSA